MTYPIISDNICHQIVKLVCHMAHITKGKLNVRLMLRFVRTEDDLLIILACIDFGCK